MEQMLPDLVFLSWFSMNSAVSACLVSLSAAADMVVVVVCVGGFFVSLFGGLSEALPFPKPNGMLVDD
ncbi:hypothetical protein B0T24DRAFT_618520 [Lasiosphaeria ovina]|uniref:Uncharacterized protein n=1 Tax=Lasiosphaeria ovina TaxID=92902 RepID=A0AAE0KGJ5_9PEZI|nr:hypothetical protein B0T24DRAFT_618520 [Lasiosphaeria ovina]